MAELGKAPEEQALKDIKEFDQSKALHSELFSEIQVKFRVGTSFSRDEMNIIFFVIFVRYFFVFSETHENENREKKAIFANYSRIICE